MSDDTLRDAEKLWREHMEHFKNSVIKSGELSGAPRHVIEKVGEIIDIIDGIEDVREAAGVSIILQQSLTFFLMRAIVDDDKIEIGNRIQVTSNK